MGYSTWSDTRSAYTCYAAGAASKSTEELFTSNRMKNYLDPAGILVRESRDSEQNPESTPIIIGVDVTGSMGIIADRLVRSGVGQLIEGIIDQRPVSDPHVMVMGIGDVVYDDAPLQVTQFEPDVRIVEQLADVYLEGGGGGNAFESYNLPWYFAANRTVTDSFEKRGKKGYLFTIGDELPPTDLTADQINRVLGNSEQRNFKSSELLEAAGKQYNVFHIIVEQGSYARSCGKAVLSKWRELMGKHAILLSNYNYLPDVILAVMRVNEGSDPEDVINATQDATAQQVIRRALYD